AEIDEALAGRVDVIDLVRDVAEVAADRVRLLLVPVVGQLDLGRISLGLLAEEHEREPALLAVAPADLAQAEPLAEEPERGRQVADPHHRVEIAHGGWVTDWVRSRHERASRPRQLLMKDDTPSRTAAFVAAARQLGQLLPP